MASGWERLAQPGRHRLIASYFVATSNAVPSAIFSKPISDINKTTFSLGIGPWNRR